MAISAFGVTVADLHDTHFGHLSDFSGDSVPKDTAVLTIINAQAARVNTRLWREGIDPADIDDATSAAYLTLQDVIRTEAAIAVMHRMTQQNPDLLKTWNDELERFYTELDELGYAALGDGAPASTGEPADGPNSHIDGNSLETEDTEDISPILYKLRASDLL